MLFAKLEAFLQEKVDRQMPPGLSIALVEFNVKGDQIEMLFERYLFRKVAET